VEYPCKTSQVERYRGWIGVRIGTTRATYAMTDDGLHIRDGSHQQSADGPHLAGSKSVRSARSCDLSYPRDVVAFEPDEDFCREIPARPIDLEDTTRLIEPILAENTAFRGFP
jgi:hypothetical protein